MGPTTGDAYRICIIAPPGWGFYRVFDEVATLLHASFRSLGIPCDVTLNAMARDRINVLLAYDMTPYGPAHAQVRYIPFHSSSLPW